MSSAGATASARDPRAGIRAAFDGAVDEDSADTAPAEPDVSATAKAGRASAAAPMPSATARAPTLPM
ncbi:MAG: hypothetical protein ACKOQ4_00185 [Mycobacterium sp.]